MDAATTLVVVKMGAMLGMAAALTFTPTAALIAYIIRRGL